MMFRETNCDAMRQLESRDDAVLLSIDEVLALYGAGACRPTWYRWVRAGLVPQAVGIGRRRVAWRRSDLETWAASRVPRPARGASTLTG
jgi:predicted DNA-binding transcriptional regulator AlpA